MNFADRLTLRGKKLDSLLEIFTILYIVSIYVFAGGHDHWQQSYSNLNAVFYIYLLCCYVRVHGIILLQSFAKLYLPFLLFCAVSCLWSWDKPYGIKLTVELSLMFILAILMYNYIVTEKKIDTVLFGFYIGGICLMFGTVLYFGIPAYFKGLLAGERMGHILGNLNDEGVHSAYSALIALYFCIYRKKWLNSIPFVVLFIFAMGTQSRKVFAILAMGVFLLIFLHNGWKYKVFSALVAIVLVLSFAYLPIFNGVEKRILEALSGGDFSTNIRQGMIREGFAQFKKNPLFGIGIGSSHVLMDRALDFDSYTHCNYIELLLITGAVGTVLWYSHYLFAAKTFILKSFKGCALASLMLTFMIVGLVVQLASVEYQERFTIIIVMLFFAVRKILVDEEKGV